MLRSRGPTAGRASTFGRALLGLFLGIAFVFQSVAPGRAGTVGTISGHVTDSATGRPLADVQVKAVSPGSTARATTDTRGFYTLVGLNPDTYTVSFQLNTYQPQSFPGLTVFADQVIKQDVSLDKSLRTIATVHSRGVGGAYQPNQTSDTYAVTAQQIQAIQGTVLNDNADQLLKSLPGASSSTNRNGAVIVRGGRANAIGFSFGGMSLVNSYNNQISVLNQGNIGRRQAALDKGNILPTIGIAQMELTPGVADASFSSTGTGNFNAIPKTGQYPGFSDGVFGIGGGHYYHAAAFDYGIASPNGRVSEYFAFQGSNGYPNYGNGLPCAEAQACEFQALATNRSFMNNLSYRFGKNNKYTLSALYLSGIYLSNYDYGVSLKNRCFRTCTSQFAGSSCPPCNPKAFTTGGEFGHVFTVDELWNVMGFETSQQSYFYQTLGQAGVPFWGNGQYRYGTKLEFDDHISPTSYLQARWYSSQGTQYSDWFQNGIYDDLSGPVHDIGLDFVKQLNDRNLLKLGFDSQFEHPIHTFNRTTWAPEIFTFNNNGEIFDFVNPKDWCGLNFYSGQPQGDIGYCGYLFKYFPSSAPALRAPADIAFSDATRWTGGYYLTDRFTPSDRLTIDAGLRLDQANYHYPAPAVDQGTCTAIYTPVTYVLPTDANGNPVSIVPGKTCPKETFADIGPANRPHILQPRIAALFKVTPNDVVRASYGRSFSWAPQSEVGTAYSLNKSGPYTGIPAYENPAAWCIFEWGFADAATRSPQSPCSPSTGLPVNVGQSVGFYNAFWPFPCPLGMTLAQCKQWNPNYPYPPSGQVNPAGPSTGCGISPYYVPCANYQEELQYETWNDLNYTAHAPGINPMAPSTFSNYDVSYEHQFLNGVGPRWLKALTEGTGVKLTAWARRGFNIQAVASLPGVPNAVSAYGAALYGGLLNVGTIGNQEYANIFTNGYTALSGPNGSYGIGQEWDNGLELELTRERTYGLSLYYAATFNHTVSNLPSDNNALSGFVPGASLFLHELYPEGFVPKFTATFVPSFHTKSGWRIAAQFFYNNGFPTGTGRFAPAYIGGCTNTTNGQFNPNTPCTVQTAPDFGVYMIPNTNLSQGLTAFGGGATQYVDPLDPGSFLHPNIAATSGTKEGRYMNSQTTPPSTVVNLQIEKELSPRFTLGLNIDNVIGDASYGPELNTRYQPLATGVSGPLTGLTSRAYPKAGEAPSAYNYDAAWGGRQPYVNFPSLEGRTWYLYLTIKNI